MFLGFKHQKVSIECYDVFRSADLVHSWTDVIYTYAMQMQKPEKGGPQAW